MVKKTAVKKFVVQNPAGFKRDVEEVKRLAKDLELDIGTLKKKLDALCMSGYIVGPPKPPKK